MERNPLDAIRRKETLVLMDILKTYLFNQACSMLFFKEFVLLIDLIKGMKKNCAQEADIYANLKIKSLETT